MCSPHCIETCCTRSILSSHWQPGPQELIGFLRPSAGKLTFLESFGDTVLSPNPTPHLRVKCQFATTTDLIFERSSLVIRSDEGLSAVNCRLKYERDNFHFWRVIFTMADINTRLTAVHCRRLLSFGQDLVWFVVFQLSTAQQCSKTVEANNTTVGLSVFAGEQNSLPYGSNSNEGFFFFASGQKQWIFLRMSL